MDGSLYSASFTLYSLPLPTPRPLLNLLASTDESLQTHATKLHNYLNSTSRRPAYEAEEEKEKLGSLRSCEVAALTAQHGIVIAITYDRAVYKFILYTPLELPSQTHLPLLLAKANASLTRRVFAYLVETFHLGSDPEPLKLSSHLLLSTLQNYISSLRQSLDPVAETESILSLLRDIVGVLKITISVNPAATQHSSIASSLRTIDLDVPSETLHKLLEQSILRSPAPRSRKDKVAPYTFLASLRDYTRDRTGLILPITPALVKQPFTTNMNDALPVDEPPLRVTRIQSTAFAIGIEGRLKFSSKPVEMMNIVPGLTNGDENVVRLANKDLLAAIVLTAERARNPG